MSSRRTSFEERLTYVQECIAGGNNYSVIAKKYGVSYPSIYKWVKKYQENGVSGLLDRRCIRTSEHPTEVSELDKLRNLVKELQEKNAVLQKEIDCYRNFEEVRKNLS